ncbi:hypothetical protein POTOM_053991 [Populus tomentosa]|uniref:Uncharacterized protein n=1 Tax=Populus tomentosa TaxID=118781 RepID=A0A8X8BZR7_POPTO|nr:hypothetical protein POTOM_053991 [Populus tomentosa]
MGDCREVVGAAGMDGGCCGGLIWEQALHSWKAIAEPSELVEARRDRNESESIRIIVEYISYKLSITLPTISKNLVGIDSRLEGKEKIEAIFMDMPRIKEAQWNMKAFSKMSRLRLLKIDNVQFSKGPEDLSNKLRFLEWHSYPSKSLPAGLQVDELVELHMANGSLEQLWYGCKGHFLKILAAYLY